jgi:hypothetical protein
MKYEELRNKDKYQWLNNYYTVTEIEQYYTLSKDIKDSYPIDEVPQDIYNKLMGIQNNIRKIEASIKELIEDVSKDLFDKGKLHY